MPPKRWPFAAALLAALAGGLALPVEPLVPAVRKDVQPLIAKHRAAEQAVALET